MKIGIIGAGNMGSGLAKIWTERGHEVMLGSRDPKKASETAAGIGGGAKGGSIKDAASFGEIVLIATPWSAAADAIQSAGSFEGKIVIDCTNPLEPDMSGLVIGRTTSAAEEIAKMAHGGKVVKAFNTVFAQIYHSPSRLFGSRRPTMFFCGDDEGTKTIVKKLITETGFEPVDAGPLSSARYLEPLAMLMIQLGYGQKMGTNIALSLMGR